MAEGGEKKSSIFEQTGRKAEKCGKGDSDLPAELLPLFDPLVSFAVAAIAAAAAAAAAARLIKFKYFSL